MKLGPLIRKPKQPIQESMVNREQIEQFLTVLVLLSPILGKLLIAKIKDKLSDYIDKMYPTSRKTKKK